MNELLQTFAELIKQYGGIVIALGGISYLVVIGIVIAFFVFFVKTWKKLDDDFDNIHKRF